MTIKHQIEPGVLPMFRLFSGAMCALQLARLVTPRWRGTGSQFNLAMALLMGLLFVYLSWPRLRVLLGRYYLPLALLVASVGPIVADAVAGRLEIASGAAASEPARLYFWLIPPLILISAQYGVRELLWFTAGTAVLPLLLLIGSRPGPTLALATALNGVARVFLFTTAGFFVVRLSSAQRRQRRELAERNQQLAEYAATQEQLAVSRERNRLARELHDTLAHTLSAISVQLTALDVLLAADPDAARAALPQLQQLARDGMRESRRALHALRAHPIESQGLLPALRSLAEQTAGRDGVGVRVELPAQPPTLRPEVEQQLYRIAEEALANSARHSGAQQIDVSLTQTPSQLRLAVADDGAGFDVRRAEHSGRYGLRGIRERAALLGATVEIDSRLQHGTTVRVVVPLAGEAP